MMLLFYGSAHIRLSTTDYTSTLAFIGVLTGAHIFCFLIIYQFRKNLVEERIIRRNARNGGNNGGANNPQPRDFAPSAPYGPGKNYNIDKLQKPRWGITYWGGDLSLFLF